MDDETRNLQKLYTCVICDNLFDKATALKKCQHIFCWKCIHGKITQHDWHCCPVCYVEFGPDPLRRLSYDDPLLVSMGRNNLFPEQEDEEIESGQEDPETESKSSDDETKSEDSEDMETEDMETGSESDGREL